MARGGRYVAERGGYFLLADNTGVGKLRCVCLAACTQWLLLRRDRRRRQEQCSNQGEFLHVRHAAHPSTYLTALPDNRFQAKASRGSDCGNLRSAGPGEVAPTANDRGLFPVSMPKPPGAVMRTGDGGVGDFGPGKPMAIQPL